LSEQTNRLIIMVLFIVLFEDGNGSKIRRTIKGCSLIEDATIEATNIAEDNGWEMLQIDEA